MKQNKWVIVRLSFKPEDCKDKNYGGNKWVICKIAISRAHL